MWRNGGRGAADHLNISLAGHLCRWACGSHFQEAGTGLWRREAGQVSIPDSRLGLLTTFGLGEAVVQPEDHLLHEVLDFTLLWATNEHHPVVGEPLRGGLLAQLGTVPQL